VTSVPNSGIDEGARTPAPVKLSQRISWVPILRNPQLSSGKA
jgi:hypothetical protein